jgi:ATP-binding cassette subfamily B protein
MLFLFRFLFRNLKGYRWLVVIALLISIAEVVCTLGAAFPVKFITSKVGSLGNDPSCTFTFLGTDYQQGILGFFDNPAIDPSLNIGPAPQTECPATPGDEQSILHPTLTQHSEIGVIVFSVVLLIVLSIFSAILGYFDLYIATYIAQNLSARLRTSLFEHLQRLSLDWHGKQKKGDLIQRITANIADIEKLVTDGLVDLLVGGFTLAGVLIIMLLISWQYTLLTLAIAPFLFAITVYYTRGIKAATKRAAKEAGAVAEVATEDINALTVIKVFTREELEDMRFGKRVVQTRQAGLLAGFLQAQFAPLVGILLSLGTAVVIGVGGYVAAGNPVNLGFFNLQGGSVDVGTLVLFLLFLNVLFQPMKDLAKLNNLMNVASAGAERIQEVLDQAPEVIETTTPYYGPQRLKGDITFEHVVFSYTPERPVLKDINLHIPAGKRVALVGLSGGGKTTLVKLIARFYEIQQGAVKIDGVDNRMYPLNVLRNNISMVLQDSVLFEGTIRDNIALGRPGATEEEIIDAAKKAHMHETIMSWPDGYNTRVREQGRNFSGGQRQRIAIARAILRDAPILILDEPTAALDVEAEAEVMRALDTLIIGRTVILISHRLSTLGRVDQIIVLGNGRIVEQGTYRELKRLNGVFAGLLEEQNRYSADQLSGDSVILSAFTPRPFAYEPPPPARPTPLPPTIPPHGTPPSPISQHGIPPSPLPAFNNNPISNNGIVNNPISNNGIINIPASNNRSNEQTPQRARVIIEVDGKVTGTHPLDKPVLTVGRLSGNDVQVPSQRVSRMHARIRWEHGSWFIEDAESLNGIVFQGNRVSQHELRHGDQIALAPQTFLRYEIL